MTKDKGVTLVALVVTIVVLLILAAITINAIVGNNGIINKTKEAKRETIISREKEGINSAVSSAKIGNDNIQELNRINLQKGLDGYFGENKAIASDRQSNDTFIIKILDTNNVYQINDELEISQTTNQIVDKVYEISKSDERQLEIFSLEDVKGEVDNYKEYKIVGISNSISGEYKDNIKTEFADISVPNIKEAKINYKLTKIMNSDEEFFVKIDINNGEKEKIQKISMSRADCIEYSPEFAQYTPLEKVQIVEEQNSTFKKVLFLDNAETAVTLNIEFNGTGCEVIGYKKDGNLYFWQKIDGVNYHMTDDYDHDTNHDVLKNKMMNLESGNHELELGLSKKLVFAVGKFYIDSIRIYK